MLTGLHVGKAEQRGGELVRGVKESRPGRLLIFVDAVDRLSPELRWQLFDGLRLLLRGGADATGDPKRGLKPQNRRWTPALLLTPFGGWTSRGRGA